MASASAMQLHTCFAFGMCSPVTFMRKLTCLAGPELRESLQEVDSIAAWPGLDEKMSQIDFSVPVITSLSQLFYCVCSFRINHSSGRVSHLKKPQTFTQHFGLCSSVLCQTWKRSNAANILECGRRGYYKFGSN